MVGRKKETEELNRSYNSSRAQLVAVYGRRRVGKTYLVDEVFKGKIAFRHAGLSPVEVEKGASASPLKAQLKHFYNSLLLHGMKKDNCPENWLDAFLMLEMFLESKNTSEKQIVFLDELPWMDTPRSGFITAFEGFWNTWGLQSRMRISKNMLRNMRLHINMEHMIRLKTMLELCTQRSLICWQFIPMVWMMEKMLWGK